ncbi:MAG: replication restart helicase PriA, partial [Vicinamibacteria bacterium]
MAERPIPPAETPWVEIALPLPLPQTFTYSIPKNFGRPLRLGDRVLVPFRKKRVTGFVVGFPERTERRDLRPLEERLDEGPLLTPLLLDLLRWASQYYLHPLGAVIKTALPAGLFGVRAARARQRPPSLHDEEDDPAERASPPSLMPEQERALREIEEARSAGGFHPFLLFGVTGSGKTEIYLRAIEAVRRGGRSAIVLVPEIALTPQLVRRFRERIEEPIAVQHSGLTRAARLDQWRRIHAGELRIVIGVRSAVFSPVEKLGIVIVDEEHDGSYKQEEGLRYNARDVAVVRAKREGAIALLGSATPSLESYHNAKSGRYRLLRLPSRVEKRPLPEIDLVDMRGRSGEGLHRIFSKVLL